jgi:hypothetical protein
MDQHAYVANCLKYYKDNGIIQNDPEEGIWNNAHYPAPNGAGNCTVSLLWEHHQVQGILQSEEYGRCCFWAGHARRFLDTGPFVEGWFELWDLYEKWSSFNSDKMNKTLHLQKDGRGKSLSGIRASQRLHSTRNPQGKSIRGLTLAKNTNKQQWKCTETGFISNPGALTNYQKAKGIDIKNRIKIS